MGKTIQKITNTKGTSQTKIAPKKHRNGTDLTEAEDIKTRWQELYRRTVQKDLTDPDNHDGVITHLEPDILQYINTNTTSSFISF